MATCFYCSRQSRPLCLTFTHSFGKLSNQDLDKAISYLETALKIAEDSKAGFAYPPGFPDEGKKRLRRSFNFLKKEKDSRLFSTTRPM